jgi:murein DD-endopeptidase MepM/ murein hydrolase activator NlpD
VGIALLIALLELWPACPAEGWVTSEYGRRRHPITHRRKFHYGIDLANKVGTPVHSPWGGRVQRIKRDRAKGLHVEVQAGPYRLTFAHLDAVDVSRGDEIPKGALVGRMGRSGRVTGPHLHLEMRRGARMMNPSVALLGCPTPP